MSKTAGKLVLGLETGLDGGSISVFEAGREIDFAFGSGNISKSEDILLLLESLLEKNAIEKSDIGTIVVSDGPGSLTGIRIGLSIAKGLSTALAADIWKISVLEALVSAAGADRGTVRAALYTARNGIYSRAYRIESKRVNAVGEVVHDREISEFTARLQNSDKNKTLNNEALVLNEDFQKFLSESFERKDFIAGCRLYSVKGSFASSLALAGSLKRVR